MNLHNNHRPAHDLKKVATAVGQFIEYWGFRNIHGRVWTIIYLSPQPISTQEIIQRLEVSKGLISRSIQELLEYGLIKKFEQIEFGRQTYVACDDIGGIVCDVLKKREMKMLTTSHEALKCLQTYSKKDLDGLGVEPTKLDQLMQLTSENEKLLKLFLRKRFRTLPQWVKFTKIARGLLKL